MRRQIVNASSKAWVEVLMKTIPAFTTEQRTFREMYSDAPDAACRTIATSISIASSVRTVSLSVSPFVTLLSSG
ncbi:MAG: hypothetical protein U0165_06020 [Polyangiaceae bacterium]